MIEEQASAVIRFAFRRASSPLNIFLLLACSWWPPCARAEKFDAAKVVAAAESEDANAQFQLARAYLRGDGVPKDAVKALELMTRAAAQGHAEALGGVGYLYATGTAVAKDEQEAVRWYREGAEKGAAKAQLGLGQMLASGRGAPRNEEEGLPWIERAAAQNLAEANLALGEIYFFGKFGRQVNYKEAFRYLCQAAEAGYASAQNTAGVMLRDGMGVEPDLAKAESWLRKAAVQGDARGQSNLGHLLGPDGDDGAQRLESLKWLLLAAQQNDTTAVKTLNEVLPNLPPSEVTKARAMASEFAKKRASTKAE